MASRDRREKVKRERSEWMFGQHQQGFLYLTMVYLDKKRVGDCWNSEKTSPVSFCEYIPFCLNGVCVAMIQQDEDSWLAS